ncbi:type VI secretion system-associated FHA domain protein TagH [Rheinheimera hassiensis]|uniref:type VI secretion system-associated FHA domain protein TagH n=1 Tax=Rheinheimera hassiensis TaxID=1193627 RepID=UPI001F0559D0|nr:type VI secretion system-associated FHA domain protein TagH [Rheinheimera hassiensis]
MGQKDRLLELSVLSYHRLSPKQVAVKRFDTTGGTLGRSERADWYLPDPERVVSGVHASISCNKGLFSITDQSTNGLFVNRAVEALGQGNSHQLKHGDVLCMGDYEIQVALIDALPDSTLVPTAVEHKAPANALSHAAVAQKATSAHQAPAYSTNEHTDSGFSVAELAGPAFGLASAHTATSARDNSHEMTMDEHFLAPSALIPDDWEAPWQQKIPEQPIQDTASTAVNTDVVHNLVKDKRKSAAPAMAGDSAACLQAFLHGLGVSQANIQSVDSSQWWEQLGQALQQSLLGVMDVMRARSEVKNSFRVNQTTFQQRENNPLKFSASIDDAFHNLFNRPGSSFMPARQAIAEAFADISQHEAAIIAGARGAMAGMLVQLAPQKIEAADFGGSFVDKLNPAQRQARYWAQYKALHTELSAELGKKNQQGVNDDFISAYEAYLRSK